ncbi:glutamate 5-kinase [Fibrobacterota bacterium]
MEKIRAEVFKSLKSIVIKIGTKILVNENGSLNMTRINSLIKDICVLKREGHSIVMVSSGAVGLGMTVMGLKTRPRVLALKQACAAAGQGRLMHLYAEKFQARGQQVAQILLSADDFLNQDRYNNIRRTVQALLDNDIIPIINENDTISTEEIKVGDNDKLSSDVAHFLEADLLVILSDEKGLYTKNPKRHSDVQYVSIVPKVTAKIESMGGGAGTAAGVGGMRAKLKAIKQATEAGTPVVLTDGKNNSLCSLVSGQKVGTLFLPNAKRLKRRKRWLAFVSHASGSILLDPGGGRAVQSGRSSVLAVGIIGTRGNYKAGDFVEISTGKGPVIGRGRTAYSAEEVDRIKGLKSAKIPDVLKRKGPEEVIHRDNLVVY